MNFKFLDDTGLSHFWGKIKAHVLQNGIFYGTCTTAKGTVAKVATVSGVTELKTGITIAVKFTNENTSTSPTLKVNSLDAKAIKRYGTTAVGTSAASSWQAGAVVTMTYDGTNWVAHDWNNTTYTSMTVAEYEAGTGTTARSITPARLKGAILTWALPATFTESDPVFSASAAHGIASTDITAWNGASYAHYYDSNQQLQIGRIISTTEYTDSGTGVHGYIVTIDDGSLDGKAVFFPDSAGLSTASQQIISLIPTSASDIGAQETLVSGTNIKTINNTSLLGSGDITISSGLAPLVGNTSNTTPTQVKSALREGRTVCVQEGGSLATVNLDLRFTTWNGATDADYSGAVIDIVASQTVAYYSGTYYLFELVGTVGGGWELFSTSLAEVSDIPTLTSQLTNDSGFTSLEIQTGEIDLTATVAANSYVDKTVQFSPAFSTTPTVTCTLYSTSTAGGIGRMTAAVTSFSTTGFTCRIFNGDTSARQPSVLWIAVAK